MFSIIFLNIKTLFGKNLKTQYFANELEIRKHPLAPNDDVKSTIIKPFTFPYNAPAVIDNNNGPGIANDCKL